MQTTDHFSKKKELAKLMVIDLTRQFYQDGQTSSIFGSSLRGRQHGPAEGA